MPHNHMSFMTNKRPCSWTPAMRLGTFVDAWWAESCDLRELPQVSFLPRQKFYCDKHVFIATKVCLSRQNYVCPPPPPLFFSFSWQTFCRNKHNLFTTKLVTTRILLSRQRRVLLRQTRVLSRQKWYLWQPPPMIDSLLPFLPQGFYCSTRPAYIKIPLLH